MEVVLVDSNWKRFLPLTFTKPVSELRCGILTIKEKWELLFRQPISALSETYLNDKYYAAPKQATSTCFINSKFLPTDALVELAKKSKMEEIYYQGDNWVFYHSESGNFSDKKKLLSKKEIKQELTILNNWWDLYKNNGNEIESDFELVTQSKVSAQLSETNLVIGDPSKIFIEEGCVIEGVTFNTKGGSIYIGKQVEIMEGVLIRGGFSVLDNSQIKLGAKIYGPTSIGPKCKVGGEVKNCIIQGYSNKSHDGYLGNSVLGEWVNLGADTNCSNLKNTFSEVKIWDYESQNLENSGEKFIGCCIGDYSKTGINTMLNTGTILGINTNVYGAGFPRKFVPSFSWGEQERYQLEKAIKVNQKIAEMFGEVFTSLDEKILSHVYNNGIIS